MNRLYISLVALMAISSTQLFADYTIKNTTDADAEVYLIGKSYDNISKGSKGNMAYDFQGKLEGAATRFIPAGQDTTYSWDDGDARSGLPIDAVMVRFKQAGAYPADFSKSVQENGIAATNNQTAILTKNASGKPSIKYVDGGPLKPDTGSDPVSSVAADLIQARKDAAKAKLQAGKPTLFPGQ